MDISSNLKDEEIDNNIKYNNHHFLTWKSKSGGRLLAMHCRNFSSILAQKNGYTEY
jgi:hypothetical protein